ncbi:hypothetical protein pb186bvf_015161 [Paramecium bursaria]
MYVMKNNHYQNYLKQYNIKRFKSFFIQCHLIIQLQSVDRQHENNQI